jgi:hypothetical protein
MNNDISDRRLYEYLEAEIDDEPEEETEHTFYDPDWQMDDERERHRD